MASVDAETVKIERPDYKKWLRHEVITVDEAVCLMTGVEPRSDLSKEMLEAYEGVPAEQFYRKYSNNQTVTKLMELLSDISHRIDRSVKVGRLRDKTRHYLAEPCLPTDSFVAYALEDSDCSVICQKALSEYQQKCALVVESKVVTKKTIIEKPILPKERETVLKLIIGMAVDGYGYNPNQIKSPIPEDITKILDGLGIALDSDTVRRWLREGATILPQDAVLKKHKTNSSKS